MSIDDLIKLMDTYRGILEGKFCGKLHRPMRLLMTRFLQAIDELTLIRQLYLCLLKCIPISVMFKFKDDSSRLVWPTKAINKNRSGKHAQNQKTSCATYKTRCKSNMDLGKLTQQLNGCCAHKEDATGG